MSCIEASGHADKDGYIKVYNPRTKRQTTAHRLAWEAVHGPTDSLLRHTCDNRKCRNVAHLIEGTQADNMKDMLDRNRLGKRAGQDNNMATVSDKDVALCRGLYSGKRGELTALGKRFGVSRVTIKNWVSGAYRD